MSLKAPTPMRKRHFSGEEEEVVQTSQARLSSPDLYSRMLPEVLHALELMHISTKWSQILIFLKDPLSPCQNPGLHLQECLFQQYSIT